MGLIEPSAEACRHAAHRGISKVYCGVIDKDNTADGSIEQMMLLDVLEHIEDDEEFLRLLCQKAARGGYFINDGSCLYVSMEQRGLCGRPFSEI